MYRNHKHPGCGEFDRYAPLNTEKIIEQVTKTTVAEIAESEGPAGESPVLESTTTDILTRDHSFRSPD